MTDRRTFTVAVSQGQFVVTWSNGSLYVCDVDDYDVTTENQAANDVLFGPPENTTTLNWRQDTSLSATSRSDFISKLNALAARHLSLDTILGRAAAGRTVRVNGWNEGSSSGWEQASNGGLGYFPTSAVAVRILSNIAADDVAGTGARTVRVEGLDANGAEVSETVDLAGLTYSSYTTQTFLRVNKLVVASVGTDFGLNNSILTAYDSGSNVIRSIAWADTSTPGATYGASVSEDGCYAVPAGYTAYVVGAAVSSSVSGTWGLYKHDFGSSTNPRERLCQYYKPSAGQMAVAFETPYVIPEKHDIYLRVNFASAAGGWFDVVLVPN